MDRHTPDQTAPREPAVTDPREASEPSAETASPARKPYVRPQLTEHGRLATLTFGGSPVSQPSDRNAKERFESIDPRALLAGVVALPIERWSYKGEPVRHLGPMAQDFAAAFGLGADDRHIFALDASGVALGALQGLHALVQAQATRLATLERELAALRRESAALRAQLGAREAQLVG